MRAADRRRPSQSTAARVALPGLQASRGAGSVTPEPEIDFVVGPEQGVRIDVALSVRTGAPRTRVQTALKAGNVTVDGKKVRPSHRLETGDHVAGTVPPREPPVHRADDVPVEIRYRDEGLVVVSKPAGLLTHPAPSGRGATVIDALLAQGVRPAGGDPERPGIVHRLDRDTSGLLIVATDPGMHAALVAAMKARTIERRYLALVRGRLPAATGTIDAPIGRHPRRRVLMAVVGDGRQAVTNYRVVDADDRASLVEATLETGRTHQIRVHLAHVGNPVLGDRIYGGVSELSRELGLVRPFLHAVGLAFEHPASKVLVEVTDALSADLAAALEASRLHAG